MKDYPPVFGKTYSLFGDGPGTEEFYRRVGGLADELLQRFDEPEEKLLDFLRSAGSNRKNLRKTGLEKPDSSKLAFILHRGKEVLSAYMGDVERHTRSVGPYRRLTDRPLITSREQYYLYMLEFELINRLNLEKFRQVHFKIALLPYCLKERHEECKAKPDEIDNRCGHCLKTCYINRISRMLEERDIHSYILSQGRISKLLAGLLAKYSSVGVLGIACVVELVWGMRLCMQAGIPVVGIPLNANRCPRWMDSMHDTSVDSSALDRLLAGIRTSG